jgi:hypothetical protein
VLLYTRQKIYLVLLLIFSFFSSQFHVHFSMLNLSSHLRILFSHFHIKARRTLCCCTPGKSSQKSHTHTHTHNTHTHTHTHTHTRVHNNCVCVCVCTTHTGKGHYILAFENFGLYLSESVTKY